MLNFFKRKKEGHGIAALDLGTEVIKAALFTVEEKLSPSRELLGKRAVIRGFSEIPQMVTDIASVIEQAKRAIKLASLEAQLGPQKLILGVPGELVKGITSRLSYSREEPQSKINLAELNTILHKLEWRAFAEARKALSDEMGYPEIDIKLIHSSVVDIRIDGYRAINPLGFQGKEVEMSLFNAFAPLPHFSSLHSIAENLGLELLGIVPEAFALSRSAESGEEGLSAFFIDIGGSCTDIALVSAGRLQGTKMFGIGGRTFSKRLALELNISFSEAEKLKKAYTADKLEPKSKKIIADTLQNDIELWLEGIVLALSEFKDIPELPNRILLSGGGAQLPEIKESLNNRKWFKKLPFSGKPYATFLKLTDFKNLIDETKKIKNPEHLSPAALANLGIELAGEESLIEKTLRKVIGIMKV